MAHHASLTIYPVSDLSRATALFSRLLNATPYVDSAYYVGFHAGNLELGLDPQGHQHGMTGPETYWKVNDIHQHTQALLEAGASLHQAVREVGGGRLTAKVKDADGNVIALLQDPQ